MKSKKLFFPAIVLAAAILVMAVFGIVTNIAKKPNITEHDFPFSITYELKGETKTFDGIYSVSFQGIDGYVKATVRQYDGTFTSDHEDADTTMIISDGTEGTIYLHTHFHPDYLMGDPEYDTYFSDMPFAPSLSYNHHETGDSEDPEVLLAHGAKIISWEYPEPIENSFSFSHIARLNSTAVLPFLIVSYLALLVIMIFVKKDGEPVKKWISVVSIIFNFLLALIFAPYAAILGVFSDINGSSASFFHLFMYLAPTITALGVAASVALRRKGFGKSCLLAQLAFPVVYTAILTIAVIFF